ncbi:hypothetical protein ACK8HX_02005 [Oryzobacter sp. R7]|uniref:hypothetical protein n=1 Tax=Oryzobacter faecalis TaxID=3388656 RepID=UPI00398D66B6
MTPKDNHHKMFRLDVEGVTTLVTRVSHGSGGEIDDHLAKLMANQCCLKVSEFRELVACPLTQEQWLALIKERCAGGKNPFMPG